MKKETKDLSSIKRLTLNKKAITKLNSKEMNSVVGGFAATTSGCATKCDATDTHGCCKPPAE